MRARSAQVLACAFVMLTGGGALAAPVKPPPLPEGSGDVLAFVYRPRAFVAALDSHDFRVDGQKAVNLRNNRCSVLRIPVGPHMLTVDWVRPVPWSPHFKPVELEVNLKPGETHYYRFTVGGGYTGFTPVYHGAEYHLQINWKLEEVAEVQARAEMAGCNFAPPEASFDPAGKSPAAVAQ